MAKANLGELLIKIGIDTKKLDAGLADAGNSLKKFGVSSKAISIGVTAAFTGMTLAVGAFGRAVNDVGAQFEQSMATVGAVAGSTQGQLGLMETRAREVGRSTLFTARQSADAMVEFARAGFKAGEIIAATEPAINLAGATASNMTSAVKGVSAALKVFQLDASQAARVADVFAVATQNSLFDLQGLIDAMKYGGPASAAFDLTIEQATAYMMVLRNMGLEASQAGVYLRQILTSAANLTPKASKIFESVGISADELNPRINHLDDIIKKLGDNAQLSAEEIQDAFGKRGGPVVAALVNQYRRLGEEGLNFLKFQKQLEKSAGKAEEMYQRQIDTVIGQFTIARSAMEDLFIEMFFGFSGELKNLGTLFAELFNEIRSEMMKSGYLGFSDPILELTDILKRQKSNIAEAFISISNAVSILLGAFVSLVQILDGPLLFALKNIEGIVLGLIAGGLVMAVSWTAQLAGAVATAGIVYNVFSGAVAFATVALGEFVAALALSTTTVLGIGAAIGLLVFGIHSLISAEEELSDLEKAHILRQQTLEFNTKKQLAATRELTEDLTKQAAETGDLSGNVGIYIDQLAQLDKQQIQVGLSAGTLFKTASGAVMSLALAFEMQKQGMEGAEALLEDAENHSKNLKSSYDKESESLNNKIDQLNTLTKQTKVLTFVEKLFNDPFERASEIIGRKVENMDQLHQVMGELTQEVTAQGEAFATLNAGIARGELEANLREQNSLKEEANEKTEEALKLEADLAKARKATFEFELKMFREIENLRTKGLTSRLNDLNAELDAINELYVAELEAAEAAGKDTTEITERFYKSGEQARLKSRLETINKLEELEESSIERTASMREMTQAEELNLEYLRQKAQLDRIYALELEATGFSWELAKKLEDAILALKEETIARAEEIRRADENKRLADIDRITTEIGTRDLKESERLALEKNRILSKLKEDEVGKRLVIESDYDFRIRQAEKNERRNIIQFINWRIRRGQEGVKRMLNSAKGKVAPFIVSIFGRDKESDRYMKRQSKKVLKERLKLQRQLDRQAKINERRLEKGKPEREFGRLKESAKEAAQGIGQVIGATLGAAAAGVTRAVAVMKSISGVVSSVIGKLSGFSFSPTEMARELVSAQEKALEEGAGFSYAAEARKYVDGLVDQAVAFTTALANGIGPALEQLVERLPEIMEGIIAAIPKIADALASNLPDLIMVVIDNLPALFTALVDGLVDVALALFDALPEMLTQLLSVALPQIITSLLSAIPKLIKGFVDALPGILTAIIESIPVIIEAILASLPDITVAIIQAIPVIVIEIIKAIPRIAVALVVGIFKGLTSMMGRFGQIIAEAFASVFAFFKDFIGGLKDTLKGDPEKNAGQKALTTLVDILTFGGAQRFEKMGGKWVGNKGTSANPDGGSAYSGISYVPANMRVNVHKGEAIIPANRNAQMNRGGMDRAAPASYGGNMNGSGGQPIDIAIMAEGRLLDAVQITAMRRGHAPEIKNELRRASGVTVGFNRGSFDYWTK